MTEHAANGIYDGAAVTIWERGSPATVIWNNDKSGGGHRGRKGLNFPNDLQHFPISP